MIELNITFFIQLVNFLLILTVLNLILYRPIRGVLKKREEHARLSLQDTENFLKLADERLKKYEAALEEARDKGGNLRQEIKAEAYEAEKNLLDSATRKAARQIETARESITKQQEEALGTLQNEIKKHAQAVAKKILTRA